MLRSLVTASRATTSWRDPVPPRGEASFDLILCRNVLIYFGATTVERACGSRSESARRPAGS